MGYRLTEAAEFDLIDIYVEGASRFGVDQANLYHDRLTHSFDLIAAHPRLARERRELVPPVRVHPSGVQSSST